MNALKWARRVFGPCFEPRRSGTPPRTYFLGALSSLAQTIPMRDCKYQPIN